MRAAPRLASETASTGQEASARPATPLVDGATIGLAANPLYARGGRIDGIGVYTRRLERALMELDVRVRRIVSPAARGVRPVDGELRFTLPLSLRVALGAVERALPGERAIESAIDIYHATDVLAPPLRRVPVVVTVHDTIPIDHPEWASPRLRSIKNRILLAGVRRADRVIAVSEAAVPDIVERYRVDAGRIRVASPGVGPEWFEPVDATKQAATLSRMGLRPGYFLFVGTLQPRKNVAALVRAYDRLPAEVRRERQLAIVGREGWGVEALATELRRRRAEGRCVWNDYVRHADLRDVYAGACGFVFASLGEGFGLPVLEALASGLPVLAYDLPSLREIGGELVTFVPSGDEDALVAGMTALADAPRSATAVATRRAHAAGYSWERTARRTAAVYRELVPGARG